MAAGLGEDEAAGARGERGGLDAISGGDQLRRDLLREVVWKADPPEAAGAAAIEGEDERAAVGRPAGISADFGAEGGQADGFRRTGRPHVRGQGQDHQVGGAQPVPGKGDAPSVG